MEASREQEHGRLSAQDVGPSKSQRQSREATEAREQRLKETQSRQDAEHFTARQQVDERLQGSGLPGSQRDQAMMLVDSILDAQRRMQSDARNFERSAAGKDNLAADRAIREQSAAVNAAVSILTRDLSRGVRDLTKAHGDTAQLESTLLRAQAMADDLSGQGARRLQLLGASESARRRLDQLQESSRALTSTFDNTPALARIWDQSRQDVGVSKDASDRPSFNKVRGRFWSNVNSGATDDARAVQGILRDADFEVRSGPRAARALQQTGGVNGRLDAMHRTLSIDHDAALIRVGKDETGKLSGKGLEASNLRFMTWYDNASRSDRDL